MIKLLLDKGADINVADRYSNTLLMNAICGTDIKRVQLLLDRGADVNKKTFYYYNEAGDCYRKTALNTANTAIKGASTEIVKLLKQHGATE